MGLHSLVQSNLAQIFTRMGDTLKQSIMRRQSAVIAKLSYPFESSCFQCLHFLFCKMLTQLALPGRLSLSNPFMFGSDSDVVSSPYHSQCIFSFSFCETVFGALSRVLRSFCFNAEILHGRKRPSDHLLAQKRVLFDLRLNKGWRHSVGAVGIGRGGPLHPSLFSSMSVSISKDLYLGGSFSCHFWGCFCGQEQLVPLESSFCNRPHRSFDNWPVKVAKDDD